VAQGLKCFCLDDAFVFIEGYPATARYNNAEINQMPMLKRLAVWLIETSCEAFLGSALLIVMSLAYGPSSSGLARDFSVAFAVTVLAFMWATGYLLSTAIVGVVWRSKRLWLYPAMVSVLFLAHLQWLFTRATGFTRPERLALRFVGVCIVLACTFAGNLFLRKWDKAADNSLTGLSA
jgi:hypothetical protein